MKRLFILILLPLTCIVFAITGCKDEDAGLELPGSDLQGKWLWLRSVGGDAGEVTEPSGGCPKYLVIQGNRYKEYSCYSLQSILKFEIEIHANFWGEDTLLVLDNGDRFYYHIREEELSLVEPCLHCDIHYYRRIP